MAAPWPLWPIAVGTSLLDALWFPPGGPVWNAVLAHLGGGLWIHFGASKVSRKVARQNAPWNLWSSSSQPGKLPLHAPQVGITVVETTSTMGQAPSRSWDDSITLGRRQPTLDSMYALLSRIYASREGSSSAKTPEEYESLAEKPSASPAR